MRNEAAESIDTVDAGFVAGAAASEGMNAQGFYLAECYGADGTLRWSDRIKNLVVTEGKNFALDTVFAGSAFTAAWYLGLVDGASLPTYAAGDVMSSHTGWTENTGYSNANRQTTDWSAAASGSKSLSAALSFTINATGTVAGCFLTSNNTKGGTTGVLYSAGSFTGGNRSVQSGDTLNVSYTASM